MDTTFLQARIEKTRELIVAYEDAITSLASGDTQSFTLDTGQTRQTVTKQNLKTLEDALDGMYNRLATLEARLNGSGVIQMRPAW